MLLELGSGCPTNEASGLSGNFWCQKRCSFVDSAGTRSGPDNRSGAPRLSGSFYQNCCSAFDHKGGQSRYIVSRWESSSKDLRDKKEVQISISKDLRDKKEKLKKYVPRSWLRTWESGESKGWADREEESWKSKEEGGGASEAFSEQVDHSTSKKVSRWNQI